jgi:hypothetical protein
MALVKPNGQSEGKVLAKKSPEQLCQELLSRKRSLSRQEAKEIYDRGQEAVVCVLMEASAQFVEKVTGKKQPHPSTPSGMLPVYEKPQAGKRNGKPGRKEGHPGSRRSSPPEITDRKEHVLDVCPDCGGELRKEPSRRRTRIIEDIPEAEPEVTEHTICGSYCRRCKKIVEPVVSDALPGSKIGNHLLVLTAWLHYGVGMTLSQILLLLNCHLHFPLSSGGLVQMWYRLQEILYAWYEQIGEEVKAGGAVCADETGWRVCGILHWLWCFTTSTATYYMIDRSRGEPALKKFFTEALAGVLITDFWGPYEHVIAAFKQKCFVHLLRELKKVDLRNRSPGWCVFRKKLKRLVRDALRLPKREGLSPAEYASRRARLDSRLDEITAAPWEDADAKRLVRRLIKYRDELFTFLDHEGVSADNNHGEREIRPAVIIRKNSLCNRSEKGANMQAVMMSIYRTLRLRRHDPIQTVADALRLYLQTGKLPPLPTPAASLR